MELSLPDKITVEFSVDQGCFHVDTLARVLAINRMNVCSNLQNTFLLLGLFDTDHEADAFINDITKKLKKGAIKLCI